MSSSRLSDPLDEVAKEIAKIKNKNAKKRTDADLERISYLEFMASFWVDDNGNICIPSYAMEQCFVESAKRQRLGKQAKAGFEIYGDGILQYGSKKKPEDLWNDNVE